MGNCAVTQDYCFDNGCTFWGGNCLDYCAECCAPLTTDPTRCTLDRNSASYRICSLNYKQIHKIEKVGEVQPTNNENKILLGRIKGKA